MATKALRRRAVAPEYFLMALDTHGTGNLIPGSGQCGSDLWPQANLCHSGSVRVTSKKEVSVKHLLQRLPPISLCPGLSAFMALLTISTLPDTPEFNAPTHEERLGTIFFASFPKRFMGLMRREFSSCSSADLSS